MTSMDVSYTFTGGLTPEQIRALAGLRDVYGIRALRLDEERGRIAIEYDATRLDEPRVKALVLGCAVEIETAAARA